MREGSGALGARWRFREGVQTLGRTARPLELVKYCRIPMEQDLHTASEILTMTLLGVLRVQFEWRSDAHRSALAL